MPKEYVILGEETKTMITETHHQSYYCGKPCGTTTEYYIGKTRVVIKQGSVQSELPEFGHISREIAFYAIGFVLTDKIDDASRALGTYHLPGEETEPKTYAIVDKGFSVSKNSYEVTCYGIKREKVQELYRLIRAGKIRPTDEWDGEQAPGGAEELEASRQQVLQLSTELLEKSVDFDIQKRMWASVTHACQIAQSKINAVYQLAARLDQEKWSFCSKRAVAGRINAALNGADMK